MNNRFILGIMLGLGMGFVISSSLYMIMDNRMQHSMEPEAIKNEARKLGMVDPADYFLRPEQEDEAVPQPNRIIIDIIKGMPSEEIARLLKNSDLIKSEEEFIQYLEANNLVSQLKWGRYEFLPGEDMEQIVETIILGNIKISNEP